MIRCIFFSRLQREAELRKLEEETAMRLEEEIRRRVEEKMSSEEVGLEIERLIQEGRTKLLDDVDVQLEKEKQAALAEARQKEVSFTWPSDILFKHLFLLFKF